MAPNEPWPAAWPQMERLRYLSRDGRGLLTFTGYGPYGAAASARNRHLSDAGFGAPYLGDEAGFSRHLLPGGRLLRTCDLRPELLARMAEYCAWRAREFSVADADSGELLHMSRINFAREFGREVEGLELAVERAAISDNRMAPHYWLLAPDGKVLKVDAALHGDDHFFPGPCDIAWDLAGIIVEWRLDSAAREFLLERYKRSSGDDPAARIGSYELAYTVFRLAWSRMAAGSVAEVEEQQRLLQDAAQYRDFIRRQRSDYAVADHPIPRPGDASDLVRLSEPYRL